MRIPLARLIALCVAATLLVPVAGRSSTGAERRPVRTHRLPDGAFAQLTRAPDGTTTVEDRRSELFGALDEARALLGRNAHGMALLATATRIQLEKTLGRPVPDPLKLLPRPGLDATVFEEVYVNRFAVPAGDLDGDGAADVIGYDWKIRFTWDDETDEYTFDILEDKATARRGIDGTILWTLDLRTIGDYTFLIPLAMDLDGNGRADLLRVSATLDSTTGAVPCVVVACVGSQTNTFHWTIEPQDGLTLDPLWTKTIPGTATWTVIAADALVPFAGVYTVDATAGYLDVAIAGDHNADGRGDVLINAYDESEDAAYAGVWALLAAAYAGYDDYGIGVHSSVVSSVNGTALFERAQSAEDGLATMLVAGDMSGDGNTDLLWITGKRSGTPFACVFGFVVGTCVDAATVTLRFESIDASSEQTRWTADADDPGLAGIFLVTEPFDGTGDGKQDMLLDLYAYDPLEGFRESFVLLSGSDGARAWERATSDGYFAAVAAIGPVGGAPGTDLEIISDAYDFNSWGLTMQRVDGATGTDLFSTTRTFTTPDSPFGSSSYLVGWLADADGDGTLDVNAASSTRFYLEEGFGGGYGAVAVDSGRTGTLLYQDQIEEFSGWTPAGDLNADGRADLGRWKNDAATRTVESAGLLMPSGSLAWSRADTFGATVDNYFAGMVPLGNLDGVPGDEPQFGRFTATSDGTSWIESGRIDIVASTDGSILWGWGDDIGGGPPPPPPPPPGALAGTITDANGPLDGVSVFLHNLAGDNVGATATDAAGSFTAASLPAGSYKVFFRDNGRHIEEWFDDAADFDSAATVTVASNATTTVNAVLTLRPPPANDNVADATVVGSLPFTDQVHTGAATTEAGEQSWCGAGSSVWYRYTPATPGPVVAQASGDGEPAVVVYEGSDPSSLTVVRCADGQPGSTQTSFFAMPGSTYWIQIGTEGRGDDTFVELRQSVS